MAQIARRLAELFLDRDKKAQTNLAQVWGGIDPDVVEAAALAHDLGHPPFGHLAEEELNDLIREALLRDKHGLASHERLPYVKLAGIESYEGYEGNAQSFRVVSALSVRRKDSPAGLDLTRATLNAILKYPKLFQPDGEKYGAYTTERDYFGFARGLSTVAGDHACVEAQIMDWADDITYCVHDIEDFYRAGRIPLDRLRNNTRERGKFREWAIKRRKQKQKPYPVDYDQLAPILESFIDYWADIEGPFRGTRSERQALYNFSSSLIHEFVTKTVLRASPAAEGVALDRPPETLTHIELLKDMIWYYVIYNPALGAHQHGQRRVIRTLFQVLDEAAISGKWYLFPPSFQEAAEELAKEFTGKSIPCLRRTRLISDAVSSLTDNQAMRLYHRLTASSQGSVLDPILT